MTRARDGAVDAAPTRSDADDYQRDRELFDGPEPGDQFGSAPVALDEPHRREFPESARPNVQLKVRITAEQRRRLRWIQDEDGHDLSTIVGTYIDTEYEERNPKGKR